MEYKITNRGKLVLSLFILILVANIYASGRYIVNYYNEHSQKNSSETVVLEPSTESAEISDEIVTSEEVNSTEEVTTTEEITPSEEIQKIYTVFELDDLRQFKMTIYFEGMNEKVELGQSDLDVIKAMINHYPGEKIAIAGHVNGYPNYVDNGEAARLSLERAEYVRGIFVEMGIEESLISVYNLGLERPLFKDYGNQHKNNRVEIYFEDHFVSGDGGK